MSGITHRRPRAPLDRIFFAIATRGWSEQRIADYPNHVRHYHAALTPEMLGPLGLIDAKVAGLLTHVSLMIAGLGLIAPLVASSDIEVGIIVAEIGIYLLIAVGCLRCLSVLSISDFDQPDGRSQDLIVTEMIVRRELFSLCVRAATIFTLAVFALLPFLYFWKPGK